MLIEKERVKEIVETYLQDELDKKTYSRQEVFDKLQMMRFFIINQIECSPCYEIIEEGNGESGDN